MDVIIGVDPHKASHTAVALSDREDELARVAVRATRARSGTHNNGAQRRRHSLGVPARVVSNPDLTQA